MTVLTRAEGTQPGDLDLSRRAIATLFFSGYALAAVSADAETIHTDETGLVTAEVMIPEAGQPDLPAYVARPAAKGAHPTILVVSEVFGIHEYIRDTCRRLAKLGYVAIAPAFFHRAGDPAPLTDMGAVMKIVATATNAQVMGDIAATLAWLKAQPFVNTGALGVTGFCWGGGVTWMACETFTEFKAGVAWYGHVEVPAKPSASDPDRKYPIQLVDHLHAPVLGLYGGQDKGIPATITDAMRAELKAKHKPGEIIVYPDAQHGFHADYRPSYNAAAAQDGWKRLKAWFKSHGV
ncbi:MAG: dienelactone hydrolase [Caulobacter sp.]|nr:dienelactone hydrolase [Caulobacter sp.]